MLIVHLLSLTTLLDAQMHIWTLIQSDTGLTCIWMRISTSTFLHSLFTTDVTHKPPGSYYLAVKMPLGTYLFSDVKLSAFNCVFIPLAFSTLGANVMVGYGW